MRGIEGFDHWAKELAETGYLHNHARMSFASIWLFTLKLPWSLGADFFLRHLLDGDPASNTLSCIGKPFRGRSRTSVCQWAKWARAARACRVLVLRWVMTCVLAFAWQLLYG